MLVDGEMLWFVDFEILVLRYVCRVLCEDAVFEGVCYEVFMDVGIGLFDFGYVDGVALDVLLQYLFGVIVLLDGFVVVSDIYNGVVWCFDLVCGEFLIFVIGFGEPSGVVVDDIGEVLVLVVVESSGH